MRKSRGLFAKRLGLTGIQDIDSVLDLISPVDFRSDGLGTKEVMGGDADDGWRRRAAASGGELAGVHRNGDSGLDFNSGLGQERARTTRNASRGSFGRVGGRTGACDGERRSGDDDGRLPWQEDAR